MSCAGRGGSLVLQLVRSTGAGGGRITRADGELSIVLSSGLEVEAFMEF